MSTTERNPLVASGEYERTYVCELEPGDVLATGETVERVRRVGDRSTWVHYANGQHSCHERPYSTVLVSTGRAS